MTEQITSSGYMAQLAGGRRLKKMNGRGLYPDNHPIHQFVAVMLDTGELFSRKYFGHRLFMLTSVGGEFYKAIYPEGLSLAHRAEFEEQRRKDGRDEDADFQKFTAVVMDREFFTRVWERAVTDSKKPDKPWLWSGNPATVVHFVTLILEEEYA